MFSVMDEPYFLALLSVLISVSVTLFILSLTQQDTLAQRQQIPGIKYDITNKSTTTLSNTTDLPEIGLDTNSNVSTEPCNMPPCPPGEMCIQVCPDTELQ
jgi:hypothetical protein